MERNKAIVVAGASALIVGFASLGTAALAGTPLLGLDSDSGPSSVVVSSESTPPTPATVTRVTVVERQVVVRSSAATTSASTVAVATTPRVTSATSPGPTTMERTAPTLPDDNGTTAVSRVSASSAIASRPTVTAEHVDDSDHDGRTDHEEDND